MPKSTGRKRHAWIYVVVAGAAVSVALFFLGRYTASNRAAAAAPNELPAKSIAVLPFENLSEDKANAFFAEGIQDEILTRSRKGATSKASCRPSSRHSRSPPKNLPKLARNLAARPSR